MAVLLNITLGMYRCLLWLVLFANVIPTALLTDITLHSKPKWMLYFIFPWVVYQVYLSLLMFDESFRDPDRQHHSIGWYKCGLTLISYYAWLSFLMEDIVLFLLGFILIVMSKIPYFNPFLYRLEKKLHL